MADSAASNNGNHLAAILHEGPGAFDISLVPDPLAPKRARHALMELSGDVDADVRERSAVVVSELVTNAIKHADLTDSQRIAVHVSIGPQLMRLDVTDPGPGFQVKALTPGRSDGSGGWGLWMVAEMTDRWGVDFSHSTLVWCEFDRA